MVRKIVCALLIGSSLVAIEHPTKPKLISPEGLLIFLDDSEPGIGSITGHFLAAFTQDAGPIVVSASIIARINELQKSPPAVPHERDLEVINKERGERNASEQQIYDKILIAKLDLKPDRWIVKEINPSLYLLLPKKYLQEKGIDSDDVVDQVTISSIFTTEKDLGLKVNHMRTVNFADIRKPQNKNPDEYFIKSLHTLFTVHSDYQKRKKRIAWSLFITGHGLLGKYIVGLSPAAFKKFLQFADTTIKTRLLVYESCYAAGISANLLYRDVERGVDTTYSFAIVTAALTDAPTGGKLFAFLKQKNEDIVLEYYYSGGWARPERKNTKLYLFDSFVKEVSKPDIDYIQAIDFIIPSTSAKTDVPPGAPTESLLSVPYTTVPQIKYPGLSWFSILDRHQVLTIGSILAKTWDRPFNFAKRSGKYTKKPHAILLYAQDIPFELIDNILSPTTQEPLTFVSMIPGDAVHHIKKITSANISIEKILNSFFVGKLRPSKLFVIDAIQAPFFTGEQTDFVTKMQELSRTPSLFEKDQGRLTKVIISLENNRYHIFFYHEGTFYEIRKKNGLPLRAADKLAEHQKLWLEYGQWDGAAFRQRTAPLTPGSLKIIKKSIQDTIEKTANLDRIFFKKLLHDIPLNVAVHIEPKITMRAPTLGLNIFSDLLMVPLASMNGGRKIVWFSEVKFIAPGKTHLLKDLILDASQFTTDLFYTTEGIFYKNFYKITENYMPTYEAVFKYFDQHQTLEGFEKSPEKEGIETQPLQQQLTKEAIARIKAVQEKKIQKIKEEKARQAVQETPQPTVQEIEQAFQREEEAERKHQEEAQRLRQGHSAVVEAAP